MSDDPFEAARTRLAGKSATPAASADPFESARERLAATPAPRGTPRKSASDFLAEEGTVPTRVRNWGKAKGQSLAQEQEGLTVKEMRKRTAAAVRPVLEGAGAVAGGIGGAAVGGLTGGVTIPVAGAIPGATVGAVTGSALGYATGNQLADMIEGVPNRTATQQVGKTVNQLATGASFEMGGAVLAKGAGALVQGGRNLIQRGAPFSPTRNRINAAQEFGDAATGAQGNWKTTDPGFAERQASTDSNRLAQVKQATRNRDSALFNRLNTDTLPGQRPLQPSAGQREGGRLLALEQKQRLKYKTRGTSEAAMPFDERVALNSAVNADAARNRVTKQLGRGEALPASEYASTTGERIVKSVQESEAAVKPEVRRLFNQPEFKYEMPRVEFDEALEATLKSNLDATARADVEAVAEFAHGSSSHGVTRDGADKTAAGLKSIKETIDSRISQAVRRGDSAAVSALTKVKQGVWDSFETMGKAAEAGDVAVHEGRIIYPSKLRSQIATLDERIAAEQAAGAKPDLAAMRAEMGTQPGMMKITGETDTAYQARLTAAYEKAGKPVPTSGGAGGWDDSKIVIDPKSSDSYGASFDPETGKIVVNPKSFKTTEELDDIVNHEVYHDWTSKNPGPASKVHDEISKIIDESASHAPMSKDALEEAADMLKSGDLSKAEYNRYVKEQVESHRSAMDAGNGLTNASLEEEIAAQVMSGKRSRAEIEHWFTKDQIERLEGLVTPARGHAESFKRQAPQSPALTDLTARRQQLSDTLSAAQPAEDVAASYASARRYTKEEQKDRFARDTIAGILKKGDQYGGLNTPLEQIPDKVFTPRGAHELVRAKMPFTPASGPTDPAARLAAGKQAAGELVYPHVVTKFTKAAIDPTTGTMSIPAAERFLRDNGEVLNTLGLTKDVEQIIKGQLPKAVRAHLDGLGVDLMKNPTMSARLAVKFARKQFGPSIGKYFGSTRAVMDWAHTLEISERSNVVATLRGSNTAEKLDLLALGDKVSMFGAVLAKAGWLMNSIKGAVGAVAKNPMKGAEAQVDQFIQDALLDGKAAEALLQIYRAKRVGDISQRAADALKPYFIQAGVSATQPAPTE